MALEVARYGFVTESGKVVLDGTGEKLSTDEDVRELDPGGGHRRNGSKTIRSFKCGRRRP